MTLIGMEPLCHACHACCHAGLMDVNLERGRLRRDRAQTILRHGIGVLGEIQGTVPNKLNYLCRQLGIAHTLKVAPPPPRIAWPGWVMIWEGRRYPSPYPSQEAWQRAMARAG